jgi:hypothetical protein
MNWITAPLVVGWSATPSLLRSSSYFSLVAHRPVTGSLVGQVAFPNSACGPPAVP